MTNPAWGTKRSCPNCSAHFYDLNKPLALCPKCKHQFDPATQAKARRRSAKRDSYEEKEIGILPSVLPGKKGIKKRDPEEDAGGDVVEIEDVDDIDSLDDLDGIEREESAVNSDDADDEVIIEELDAGDSTLVEDVDDQEALEYDEDEGEESEKPAPKSRARKNKE